MFRSFEFSTNELLFGDSKCNAACFNFPDDIVLELIDHNDIGLNGICSDFNKDSENFIINDIKNYYIDREISERNSHKKTDESAGSSYNNHEDSLSLCARMSESLNKSIYITNNSDVNSSCSQSSNSKALSCESSSHNLNIDFESSETSVKIKNYNDEVDEIIDNLLDDEVMINQRDKKNGNYLSFNRKSDEAQRQLIYQECCKILREKKSIPHSTYVKLASKTGLAISQIKKINYNMRSKLKKLESEKNKDD